MTSDARAAYVWVWLPGSSDPVPAGILEQPADADVITFAYGQHYLARNDARALYEPELPLRRGRQQPPTGMDVAGVIRDAGPDAWGQRVIMRRLTRRHDVRDQDPGHLSLLTTLLASGSDRPGALDFQASADTYVPRTHHATLEQLQQAAGAVEAGAPIDEELATALEAGSSAGGARPKATLVDGDKHLIAKFSSITDASPVIKAEAVAMELARRVGLHVAGTELIRVGGRDVLLVERFDRGPGGRRHAFVSALTIAQEAEMNARYVTYTGFADQLRARAAARADTLRELFSRIVFNVLVGNTDDHARNHAAFCDGHGGLVLTPAYDICPQKRTGQEASQAMAFGADGQKLSQVAACLDAARFYELTERQAREVIDRQLDVIGDQWHDAADAATLTATERDQMWGRQILNPFATYGYNAR
ncbi:MAG: HipA domain-containing protein [Nitriliruptoraceae bacterium]